MDDALIKQYAVGFLRLGDRIEWYQERSVKASHLGVHVDELGVKGAGTLVEAIDLGAFPKRRAEQNRGWWDRSAGRVPGGPLTVYGALSHRAGEPPPGSTKLFRSDASAPFTPAQLRRLWRQAICSWLYPNFHHDFLRPNAAEYDWVRVAMDRSRRPVGKDGRPLKGRWYRNGERFPADFQFNPKQHRRSYRWRLDGEVTYVEDSFDEEDWLDRMRVRAEVYGDACQLLARLLLQSTLSDSCKLTVTAGARLLQRDIPRLTFENAKSIVSIRASRGAFKTNGKKGPDRRIDRDSFNTWRLQQRDKDLDAEDDHR